MVGKKIGSIVFREQDIRDWIKTSEYTDSVQEIITNDPSPKPAPNDAMLAKFSSSDTIPIILEHVFVQNDHPLSKLEKEFIKAFQDITLDYETQNLEFAHWLFRVLISAFEAFLSTKAKKGDNTADEYLHVVRHKKEIEGQKEIGEKVDGVHNSLRKLHSSFERYSCDRFPRFTPWREYFHRVERHLMPLENGAKVAQITSYIDRSETFLADSSVKILLLHATGGSGKTHLLRQIAFALEGKHPEFTILSVTPGFPNLEKALSGELDGDGDRQYLLLFDDAERWHQELAQLFAYVKYHSSTVKVILTARTAGLQGIQTVLNQQHCQDLTEEMMIEDWRRDDLKELLRFVLGGRHHNKEELIVSMHPNPYLIIWAGTVIKGDSEITVERLQRKFVDDLKVDTTHSLIPVFDESQVDEFLADLALILPFKRNDNNFFSLLKGKYGLTEYEIQSQIDQMVKNGVLREVGYSTRFNPDMKGDLYLAHYISDRPNFDTLSIWIELFEPHFNENILTNLEAASRFCKVDIIKDYFTSWAREAIKQTETLPGYKRTKCLEFLSRFCYLVPEESIDLIYAYINDPPSESEDYAILSPNRDAYGAVVVQLIHAGFSREEIFNLLDHISQKVPEGRYSNYQIESMVAETVSPFYNTPKKILEIVSLLETRLDPENEFSIIALGKALSEVLRADHEMTYLSSPRTITWGTRALPATPYVLKTREHTISILRRMLYHQSVQVRRKAVEICSKIGSKFTDGELPLAERIADERRIILTYFEHLVKDETDCGVLSDIEILLLQWWHYMRPGTEGVELVLKTFPRPMDYVLYGFLFHSRPLLISFDVETIPSDEEGKKKWYFNVSSDFANYGNTLSEFCESVVPSLSIKYPDTESIVGLLKELQLYKEHENVNVLRLRPILTSWIAKMPYPFLELRHQEELWCKMSVELQNAIDIGLCNYDTKLIEIFAREILVAPQNVNFRRIEIFVSLMTTFPPDDARVEIWLTQLIETGRKDIHLTLLRNLRRLYSSIENPKICIIAFLNVLDCYETLDQDLIDVIATYVLHDLKENEERLEDSQKDTIKKCLKEKVISTPLFSDSPDYIIQTLINYILTDSEEVLDFIHERGEKKKTDIGNNYQILPQSGVTLFENIRDYPDLKLILDELFVLINEGFIYRDQLLDQLRAIVSMKHQASGKLCLEEYAVHLLNEGRVDDALALTLVLLSQSGTESTIQKILDDAVAAGKRKDIERIFSKNTWHDVITIIEDRSPELEQKREFISRLLNLVPRGTLRATLREVLVGIDKEMISIEKNYGEDYMIR